MIWSSAQVKVAEQKRGRNEEALGQPQDYRSHPRQSKTIRQQLSGNLSGNSSSWLQGSEDHCSVTHAAQTLNIKPEALNRDRAFQCAMSDVTTPESYRAPENWHDSMIHSPEPHLSLFYTEGKHCLSIG